MVRLHPTVDPVVLNKQESLVFNVIIFSDQKKAKCEMLFCEMKSVISVRQIGVMIFNEDHLWWHANSLLTLDLLFNKQTRPSRTPISNQTVENIRQLLIRVIAFLE